MHFSTQHSAAFAVALFCTSSIASGVTAAPVPKGNLEQAEHAAGIANELAQAYSTIHQKREPEPEPLNIGALLKDGENLLSSILKREPEPEPLNIGTLKDGENLLSSILKREPEPEPLNIGTLLKDGENLLSSILKREPEPEPLNIGTLLAARNDNALYNGLEE